MKQVCAIFMTDTCEIHVKILDLRPKCPPPGDTTAS